VVSAKRGKEEEEDILNPGSKSVASSVIRAGNANWKFFGSWEGSHKVWTETWQQALQASMGWVFGFH
jgi:hypothetical protein